MSRSFLDVSLKTLLSAAVLTALAACNREPPAQAADEPPPAASTAAPITAAPYQRPTADQLYALVAPIALFPDNLVAQTLAASTHPDQVDDARQFIQGHRDLTGAALIDAADSQPWDPSVKSLVAFPAVLDQMANNGDWTDALGQAYANQPSDVMNAIQVMRSRAQAKGNLKSTPQQNVQVVDRGEPVSQSVVEEDEIVGPPAQTIEIEPADPGVVYVPDYDPDEVYGGPVYSSVYETRYVERGPDYRDAAVAGVIGFGAGIVVAELFSHHDHHDRPYGWDSWHTSWGGHRDGGRPAVVYDNHPYVVNRTVVNNRYVDRSVHVDNRHNFGNTYNRPGPPQRPAQPDFAHMQRPTFAPAAMQATAPNAHPALPPHPVAPNGRPFQLAPGQPAPHGYGIVPTRDAALRATAHVPAPDARISSPRPGVGNRSRDEQRAATAAPVAAPQPRDLSSHRQPSEAPGNPARVPQTAQHNEAPHFQQLRTQAQPQQAEPPHEAPRAMPQAEQHAQPPREMPRALPQQRQEPRFQPQRQRQPEPQRQAPSEPQQRHEQQRPAPQGHPAPQQHNDDHKKHDH